MWPLHRILSRPKSSSVSPWYWIPTLYMAEGLPYFAVNALTVILYVNMGISVKDMTFYTGWLYLPWVIKPFWSPIVDILRTKRWWVLIMQLGIALTMAGVAFFMSTNIFFAATLVIFWLMAFFSSTHDIAADGYYMLALTSHNQAAFVGIRSTFYRIASVIGQGGIVILAGYFEKTTGNIPLAWTYIFGLLSVVFFILFLYHTSFMPVCEKDSEKKNTSIGDIIRNFFNTFVTFFQKRGVGCALLFMLLYRLPEAFCLKLVTPFLRASRETGGLDLSTSEVGFANGTVGVIALLLGGIVGGIAISRGGLKKWLWPMALSLTLPCLFYCFLAYHLPENPTFIYSAIFIEQFGYGFGFSAYMLYLIYFCQGENSTSHYAFCTAFMALGMMIPGMFAGYVHEFAEKMNIFKVAFPQGYLIFFCFVMICCIVTLASCALIKIDPSFGKKSERV